MTAANGSWRSISVSGRTKRACARWSHSRREKQRPPRYHSSRSRRPIGSNKASPASNRCAPAASSCTAPMTAPASSSTISASRSKPRSLSVPAITAPRAAACWRSTIWPKRRRAARVLDLWHWIWFAAIAAEIRRARVTASDIDRVAVEADSALRAAQIVPARGSPRARHRRQCPRHRAWRATNLIFAGTSAGATAAAGGAAQPARRLARARGALGLLPGHTNARAATTALSASCSSAASRSMARSTLVLKQF